MSKIITVADIPSVGVYLKRVGGEARSMKAAVVKEQHGKYWKDLCIIKFAKDGEVTCSEAGYEPTDDEAMKIRVEFGGIQWPTIKPLHSIINPPEMIENADKEDLFLFRNEENQIIFIQVRIEREGEKNYVPWTYWDDDEWRIAEPDGALPLYNLEKLKDAATVFIHEGAKAARYAQWMVDGETRAAKDALASHPWGMELQGAAHIGWVGGALSPARTDWSGIQKAGIKRAYIVADNDEPGKAAVPRVSEQLRIPTFMIQFTDEFPVSFDLADKFPASTFGELDGSSYYVGPSFRDCLHPATWATDLWSNPKGKPTPVLRDSFKKMWAYVEEADMFVCTEMPEILRAESILNKMLAPFSHSGDTARLITKSFRGRSTRICYRPDHDGLLVTFRGSSAINLHTKATIKPAQGGIEPWLEFLEYMFVDVDERKEMMRWCATLIAKPEVRMPYGILLVSETQGIGKTTLGSLILAPLVGYQNAGYPSETDITQSSFNEWLANKRLLIVNEIYSGHSWKAYHSLKGVITDKDITVNQKYMRSYTIENWCHVLACSNSMRALKMENDDRRWFYPEMTEVPWKGDKFTEFRAWIERGGLGIIKQWAEDFGDYVKPSSRAPMTNRKKEMIEGSRSEAQSEAADLATSLATSDEAGCVVMKDIIGWVRQSAQGRVFDSDYELRKVMKEAGCRIWPNRIKVSGRTQYVIMNDTLWDEISRTDKDDQLKFLRSKVKKPSDFLESSL